MRLRLGVRVLLVLAAVNLLIFAAAGLFLVQRLAAQNEELQLELAGEVLGTLQATILPQGGLNVPRILTWTGWGRMEDALLVDSNLTVWPSGEVQPAGIALNPVGRARRDALFPAEALHRALLETVERAEPRSIAGGRAVPILVEGRVWGACWYRPIERSGLRDLLRALLPAFVISTGLLVGASFLTLRRMVLDPVERLAAAARRLAVGERGVRAPGGQGSDELSELVRDFNAMASALEELTHGLEERVQEASEQARRAEVAAMIQRRLASMGELAAGIAHEVNNPLGGLINAAEALRRGDLAPERRERYLDLIAEGLERIRVTVGRLLGLSPRVSGFSTVDLRAVAADVLLLVRHRAERSGVLLELIEAAGPEGKAPADWRVQGLANEIGQAILNLLANALDALEDPGRDGTRPGRGSARVRVELARRGEQFVVAVEDNGPGVDEVELLRLPDLFYTTKEVGRGTGLGLSIVHRVLALHGGRVLLSSSPGSGFRAELEFPPEPPSVPSEGPRS